MFRNKLRSIFQLNFMLLVITLAALTGWACNCNGGSDYSGGSEELFTSRDSVAQDGVVDRWHDFSSSGGTASSKDLDYLHNWLQTGNLTLGLMVPQAPGALQSGSVTTQTNSIFFNFTAGGIDHELTILLETDNTATEKLNSLMAADPGTEWQVLKPSNYDWLSEVPTQTTDITNVGGSLHYQIDFHGSDPCNHCEIQLTGCSSRQFSFGEQVLLKTMGFNQLTTNGELTCSDPIPTTILLEDFSGTPLPGPVTLSFGFWGGAIYTTTTSGNITVPYMLAHTDTTTRTVNLGTLQSDQGWSYHWEDLLGNPISQIEIGPLQTPLWEHHDPNIRLVSSSLPTCEKALDQAHISASLTLTPTITAAHQLGVQVLPDEGICPVKDVGIHQIASTSAITAGQSITFTWTITNFESTTTNVTVSGTFEPAATVSSAVVPTGCTRNGGNISCGINGIPANGEHTLQVVVVVSPAYNGQFRSYVETDPVGAVDGHFYDNSSGPLFITVSGGTGLSYIYLPLVIR